MQQKKYLRQIWKYFIIFGVLAVVDYSGLLVHIVELDYARHFHYPIDGDVLQYAHRARHDKFSDGYIPPINYYNYTYLVNKECSSNGTPTRLTFVIKSALGNTMQRDAIRRTWAYEQRFSDVPIVRVFVLGLSADPTVTNSIEAEAAKNGDIVQASFYDSYYNNTIKTVLGLRWAVEYCANSQHYMFVDDDYFVSLKNVLRFLKEPARYPDISERSRPLRTIASSNQVLFAGFVLQTPPHRHKLSKWYVPLKEYPYDLWPPYVTAGAYILSHEALFELYYSSLYTQHFRFDDIFLGLTALKAKLKLTHCPHFHFHRPRYAGADSYRFVLASHGFDDPAEMERVWSECRSAGYA